MVRLIIPLITGILIAIKWEPGIEIPAGILVCIFIFVSFLLLYAYHFISFKRRWVIGVFLQAFLLVLGYQMTIQQDHSVSESHFRNMCKGPARMIARVIEPIVIKPKSFKTTLECIYVEDTGTLSRYEGMLLTYFKKDNSSAGLVYGDIIMLQAKWQVIDPPKRAGEFDYQQFMKYHGVYDRIYLSSDSWTIIDRNKGNPLLSLAYGIQKGILGTLEEQGLEGEELKVASAILAGYRAALDPELQQAFSGAGAMHILCVSGLHVGVIYLVLSSLLSFLGKEKKAKAIRSLLLIVAIWIYALVTGCAPSVMRASTMISFLVLGRWLNRSPNIYNTLAASAFLLLLIDPYMLMAIGFQLSYLAVIGIVSIQPFLYRSVYVKFWLLDKAWAIITVSIGAQAGTFPLAIYYFHQFPNYFLLTNLIVIPASSLIIYLGFLLLFSSPLPWVAGILSWLLSKSIFIMNACIHWINRIPGAVSEGLYLSAAENVLIYAIMGLIMLFIGFKKKDLIWVILSLIIVLLFSINILR